MPGFLAKLDRFTIGLIVSVGAGILVPCSGVWDTVFSRLSDAAIVLLFFLYGAKLSLCYFPPAGYIQHALVE